MTKGTVLVAGSNATRIELQGGGSAAIGQYLNETVVPAMALIEAGYAVVLATPDGTKPTIDEASDSPQHFGGDEAAYARAKRFYAEDPSMNQVRTLRSVVEEGLGGYAGLFVPGGHAPVVDLMQNAELCTLLRHFHEAGRPTALLCHGPVAIAAAMPRAREFRAALIAGDKARAAEYAQGWIYAGYRMTVFSASEERIAEGSLLHGKLYFDMPEALEVAGARVTTNPVDFAPYVVVDRELITGQNPSSDHHLAAQMVEALDRPLADAATP
ncbi:type 1 glutamine amidotransferase domain-containing protein [Belnapia sp. T18]|uniref:Type 1 glutamine amidotransferase domain-containing protein n=1 Tax=Belnapia arida TaxID=2804533 RepID=A0ABS1UER7_9PROT|nr:type 1 glutamine amidotransferase domain-containing protein [Belnapia arida]MBL6082464.1 type 1 glutamine amidotransferase domain-containing protein [Belnapia arida]